MEKVKRGEGGEGGGGGGGGTDLEFGEADAEQLLDLVELKAAGVERRGASAGRSSGRRVQQFQLDAAQFGQRRAAVAAAAAAGLLGVQQQFQFDQTLFQVLGQSHRLGAAATTTPATTRVKFCISFDKFDELKKKYRGNRSWKIKNDSLT